MDLNLLPLLSLSQCLAAVYKMYTEHNLIRKFEILNLTTFMNWKNYLHLIGLDKKKISFPYHQFCFH